MHDTGSSRSDAGQVSGRLTAPYRLFRARSSLLRTVSHAEKSHVPPAAVSAPSSDHAGHSVWRHNKNIHQIVSNHEHLSDFGGRLRHVSLPRCGAYTSCRLYEALSAARHSGRELSRYGNTSSERPCTGNRILPYAGVCAMICWMDQKSFTRLTLTPDYRTTSEIQRAQGLLEEVLPTIPDAELLYGVFYNENTEYCTFEQSRICFRRNGILFRINKQYSPKPTYAIDIDTSNFKHIDLHMQAHIRDKYPAPHRIGVLSERKVNIWVDYLTKIWHDLEHLDREREDHIAAHRSRLNKLPDVKWNKDRDRGSIERNGLCYSFRYETGTIQEKVSLDYGPCTLDDFLALSDNRYRPKC